MRRKTTVEERFWAKVQKTDTCWLWTAHLVGAPGEPGYGGFRAGGRNVRAHRFAYELLIGPIPEGLVIDHLCRNKLCVNPDHLEPVTDRENVLRGIGLPAINVAKTHCLRGHKFTPENTYIYVEGDGRIRRVCRACQRMRDKVRRA